RTEPQCEKLRVLSKTREDHHNQIASETITRTKNRVYTSMALLKIQQVLSFLALKFSFHLIDIELQKQYRSLIRITSILTLGKCGAFTKDTIVSLMAAGVYGQ